MSLGLGGFGCGEQGESSFVGESNINLTVISAFENQKAENRGRI